MIAASGVNDSGAVTHCREPKPVHGPEKVRQFLGFVPNAMIADVASAMMSTKKSKIFRREFI